MEMHDDLIIEQLRRQLAAANEKVEDLKSELDSIGRDAPEALRQLGAALTELLDDDQWNNVYPMLAAVQLWFNEQSAALAAANERAGRLEAQMVELRTAWQSSMEWLGDDAEDQTVELAAQQWDYDTLHRILGGA